MITAQEVIDYARENNIKIRHRGTSLENGLCAGYLIAHMMLKNKDDYLVCGALSNINHEYLKESCDITHDNFREIECGFEQFTRISVDENSPYYKLGVDLRLALAAPDSVGIRE